MGSPPIVVTGMHRSGTSLAVAVLRAAGVHVGDRLLGGGRHLPDGHTEDLDFVEFHAAVLADAGLSEAGWTDAPEIPWGEERREAARQLVRRREGRPVWGWKDPRTVLFLDEWRAVQPEARFVFVARPPWEVLDSLFRRGDFAFFWNPGLALRLWAHYNESLLAFRSRHERQCVLVTMDRVLADPGGLVDAVNAGFGLGLPRPQVQLVQPGLGRPNAPTPDRLAAIRTACPAFPDLMDRLSLSNAWAAAGTAPDCPDPAAVFDSWAEAARGGRPWR
jgi:hypothetical protein